MIRIVFCLAIFVAMGGCDEEKPSVTKEGRKVGELDVILRDVEKEIMKGRMNSREEQLYQREAVADLSLVETKRLLEHLAEESAQNNRYVYWEGALEAQAAFFDHQPMIEFLLGMNTELEEMAERAGRGLESNLAEATLELYFANLEAAISGWSRRDPKAAWHAVNDSEGELAGSALLDGYGYILPRSIFEHLARQDPEFAIAEFLKNPDTLYRDSMLVGLSRGLPEGFDWKNLLAKLLDSLSDQEEWLERRLLENILARWMQDDADAAMKWFRSEAGQELSLRDVGEDESESGPRQYTVESTVSFWWIRDSAGAEKWLRKNPAVLRGLLRGSEFDGSDPLYPDDLRDILMAVRDQAGREKILRRLKKKGSLPRLLSTGNRETLWDEVGELKISPVLAKDLVEARLADDSDPFAK